MSFKYKKHEYNQFSILISIFTLLKSEIEAWSIDWLTKIELH